MGVGVADLVNNPLESLNKTVLMVMVAMLALVWLVVRSIICVNLPLTLRCSPSPFEGRC
ncbi:MAG UNVERIFIED_CONTAM: hypothetical protein LVR29_32450 [Microcystis novacekii LVE1205-3]